MNLEDRLTILLFPLKNTNVLEFFFCFPSVKYDLRILCRLPLIPIWKNFLSRTSEFTVSKVFYDRDLIQVIKFSYKELVMRSIKSAIGMSVI